MTIARAKGVSGHHFVMDTSHAVAETVSVIWESENSL